MKMYRVLLLSATLALLNLSTPAQAQTVQAGLFETGDDLASVRAKPSGDFNDALCSYIQFSVRWPTDSDISIGSVTATSFNISKSGSETESSDGYTYQDFAASPNTTVNWAADQEYELVQFETTGSGSLELAPNGTSADWYIELDGSDATNHDDPFYSNSISLPVELVSFEATLNGTTALLRWATATETNNAGFEVQQEQKQAPDSWKTIAHREGAGTTTERQRYQYRVEDLSPGQHRFRLKQVDLDGGFAYSPVVELTVPMEKSFTVASTYPNPFRERATVEFAVQEAQSLRIALYNSLGRQVRVVYEGTPTAGRTHTVPIDGTGLPSGTYLLRVTGSTFTATQRIVHLR